MDGRKSKLRCRLYLGSSIDKSLAHLKAGLEGYVAI